MVHTDRFRELEKLAILLENASKIVNKMAFNEDLPVFDVELDQSLRISYDDLRNHISKLNNKLF